MEGFTLFNSFPPEIHSMILESCDSNDAVCIRLSCKYLYNLPPVKPQVPLSNSSIPTLCSNPEICMGNTWIERYQHRQQCHRSSYDAYIKLLRAEGKPEPMMKSCKTQRWSVHCECFERRGRLHHQLKNWMPQALRYCGECEKFTRRKKSHGNRCYHGRGKPVMRRETFWTHRSRRGAFGRGLWKKWFNNRAMNSYEARLGRERERKGVERYNLRQLQPKNVDTRVDRYSIW